MSQSVRWTIKISPDTDRSLRGFLGAQGMKKGDLSSFIEEAVRWRMLDRTVQTASDRFQDIPTDILDAMIDEAVAEVRAEMPSTGQCASS